jgi:hypothetical protein
VVGVFLGNLENELMTAAFNQLTFTSRRSELVCACLCCCRPTNERTDVYVT